MKSSIHNFEYHGLESWGYIQSCDFENMDLKGLSSDVEDQHEGFECIAHNSMLERKAIFCVVRKDANSFKKHPSSRTKPMEQNYDDIKHTPFAYFQPENFQTGEQEYFYQIDEEISGTFRSFSLVTLSMGENINTSYRLHTLFIRLLRTSRHPVTGFALLDAHQSDRSFEVIVKVGPVFQRDERILKVIIRIAALVTSRRRGPAVSVNLISFLDTDCTKLVRSTHLHKREIQRGSRSEPEEPVGHFGIITFLLRAVVSMHIHMDSCIRIGLIAK
ncbi:hypothetical protein T265_05822 [Opisthorchis viverrini]|uniref:Uncharacterized protein n=1 Tax=Opisthorchis viverrini TaxID=6198 RepID=A0A074ZIB9_OPIVI|nr:hypothetical protein T265_05822 [Opisthorchis viverrini]KER27063.1 hypothetical protein T265_05822 [Opisthorchis viverrini]